MPSDRLSGHTLRSEGKPFVWTANGGRYVRADGHKKEGVGLCSCGAHSQNLDSERTVRELTPVMSQCDRVNL